jgi:DNA-binding CsgD family transcriptional regulator
MLTRSAVIRPAEADPVRATVMAATDRLALTSLRIGLLLLAAVTAGDGVVAATANANATLLVVGALILTVALAGAGFPKLAGDLLRPRGRIMLLAILLAILGLLEPGLRAQYADVDFGLACLAAIVASPVWVAAFVGTSILGLTGDYLAAGHTVGWVLQGPGADQLVSQFSIMFAGAAVWVGVIWVICHTVTTAPTSLASVRNGAEMSLTPRLGAAVRGEPAGLLVRADPTALIEPLSPAEHRVLDLLAEGLLPKQAARSLEIALPTVRSHIASAKRKTGARTLEQLVGLYAEAQYAS